MSAAYRAGWRAAWTGRNVPMLIPDWPDYLFGRRAGLAARASAAAAGG